MHSHTCRTRQYQTTNGKPVNLEALKSIDIKHTYYIGRIWILAN